MDDDEEIGRPDHDELVSLATVLSKATVIYVDEDDPELLELEQSSGGSSASMTVRDVRDVGAYAIECLKEGDVVRCGYCKHYAPRNETHGECRCVCPVYRAEVSINWYCAEFDPRDAT